MSDLLYEPLKYYEQEGKEKHKQNIDAYFDELVKRFPAFLDKALVENPLKGEFFLPMTVDDMLQEGIASVDVLITPDKWYGVTYAEDKPKVTAGIQSLKDKGIYPEILWTK